MRRVTQKDLDTKLVEEGTPLCDVEIRANDVPIQIRAFDCMQCPHGVISHDLTAPQLRDHLNVLHVDRGDVIPDNVKTWANRQANMFRKTMAELKKERQDA